MFPAIFIPSNSFPLCPRLPFPSFPACVPVSYTHLFGLSDLHQMRGRVGRSNKKAFCYLLAPPLGSLTVEGRRRLQAIEKDVYKRQLLFVLSWNL